MKKKRLLAAILLVVIFCFVSGVGSHAVFAQGIFLGEVLAGVPFPTDPVSGTDAIAQRAKYVKRRTFLVFSINGKEELKSMLWNILGLYPEAEIPEEFTWILPCGINSVDKMREAVASGGPWDFGIYSVSKELMLSLLLTMAYQQGYEIEHVTSNYMVLVKHVEEEDLKEWKERRAAFEKERKEEIK